MEQNSNWFSQAVSIHAPARGATFLTVSDKQFLAWVSIHAPARGATILTLVISPHTIRFQSTHPRGVRLTYCKYP